MGGGGQTQGFPMWGGGGLGVFSGDAFLDFFAKVEIPEGLDLRAWTKGPETRNKKG